MHHEAGAIAFFFAAIGRPARTIRSDVQYKRGLMNFERVAKIQLDAKIVDVRCAFPAIAQGLKVIRAAATEGAPAPEPAAAPTAERSAPAPEPAGKAAI